MRKTLSQIMVLFGVLLLVAFVVFMINQTAQLVAFADRLDPFAGEVVLWTLIALYGFCILVPIFLILRLPAPLAPPDTELSPEFPEHIKRLARRLRKNSLLAGHTISSREEIEEALRSLDIRANEVTKKTGTQVFMTTAISQNGTLDALVVLAAQSKLVLEIARIYYQRPSPRDLIFLYTNVASTAFITSELEDVDLSEQIQPVLTGVLGSAAGAIPGLQAASALFVNSVMTGSANAFLTLRVGVITKQYCRAVVLPARRTVRRAAVAQATRMLGGIAWTGARTLSNAMWTGSKKRIGDAVGGAGDQIKSTATSAREKLRFKGKWKGTDEEEIPGPERA